MSGDDAQPARAQVRARYAEAGGQALAGGRPSCADGDDPAGMCAAAYLAPATWSAIITARRPD